MNSLKKSITTTTIAEEENDVVHELEAMNMEPVT